MKHNILLPVGKALEKIRHGRYGYHGQGDMVSRMRTLQ